MVKKLSAVQETQVGSLGLEDPLEREIATYSRILAKRNPWTEEPGGLHSMRVWQDWMTSTFAFIFPHRLMTQICILSPPPFTIYLRSLHYSTNLPLFFSLQLFCWRIQAIWWLHASFSLYFQQLYPELKSLRCDHFCSSCWCCVLSSGDISFLVVSVFIMLASVVMHLMLASKFMARSMNLDWTWKMIF